MRRAKASPAPASFRRKKSLEACLEEARRHVEAVSAESDDGMSEVQAAARKRAARERLDRIQRAIKELPKAQEARKSAEAKEQARVSTTEDAKSIYKERAATAESINADLKCFRGLDRVLVRTLPKVMCVVFWTTIAYNALKLLAQA